MNHLLSQDLAALVDVGVDYASDLGQVEYVVVDAAGGFDPPGLRAGVTYLPSASPTP